MKSRMPCAAAHGDINLLTVLPAATQAGLQVLGKDNAWHDVPCDFGMLIVNIGDMLDEASQGYYPSTIHRVLNPTGEEAKKSYFIATVPASASRRRAV
jgi:isopenicillin N synthase-like dioxygenase